MSLKHDLRRPVPEWLKRLNPAKLSPREFSSRKVIEHSLYYPAAGVDGRPIQFLAGFIHSFIHVDYGMNEQAVDNEVKNPGFSGYHLAGATRLSESDLTPGGWQAAVPARFRDQIQSFISVQQRWFVEQQPFATWYIFDRDERLGEEHGPQRFSLVHICADGVATYQALYYKNKTSPEVLAIIQPGTGFGGNYTDFRDPEGFFAWTVLHGNGLNIPEYLVCGGLLRDYNDAYWPKDYTEHVDWFQYKYGIGVWRRGGTK